MQVKELVKLTANYLQLNDVLEYFEDLEEYEDDLEAYQNQEDGGELTEPTEPTQTSQVSEQLNNIISCVNAVAEDIATNYIPLIKHEEILAVDNEYSVSQLDKTMVKIIKVLRNGFKISYRLDGLMLKAPSGINHIVYTYLPSEVAITDNVETFGGVVTGRTFLFGVCAEYCLLSGGYDEAEMWEQKFKNSLLNSTRKQGEIKIKKRRWA